jgi:citrate lyase subunit beta/citryl-CoA lyase
MSLNVRRRPPAAVRSFLFAPGNHARRVEKVFSVGADAVILDLEDAVATLEKQRAREMVLEALRRPRTCRAYVRVNAFDTRWCLADLEGLIGPWLDGVVLPKTENPEHLQIVAQRISQLEDARSVARGTLDLMAIVETAKGVLGCEAIAAASPRLSRLAFGGGDYTHDLDLEWSPGEEELAYARARLTHASRVAGLEAPVDTVVLQVKDMERFRLSARNGRRMGFFGKLCIHPDQVGPCNEVFTPTADEVTRARAVVAAFEAAEAAGSASIQLDGQFIDYPVVHKAQRVLLLAERVAAAAGH